ncbi:MAG: hypothetical protein HQL69_15930 [Magnetococcales bacterium]|nr:hypothetical protein [Magnetococcales bacterium]
MKTLYHYTFVVISSFIFVTGVQTQTANATNSEQQTAVTVKKSAALTPWANSYKLEGEKKYEQATRAITPYLKDIKTRELAVMRIAWLAYLQGNYNKAIKGYKQALFINPRSINAQLGITLPLMAQKRWRETRNYLNTILKTSPWNYTAHQRLLVIDEVEGRWKSMTNHAKALTQRFPDDTTALVYLARGYAWLKKPQKAVDVYNRVLLLVPGHYEATKYLNKHEKKVDD